MDERFIQALYNDNNLSEFGSFDEFKSAMQNPAFQDEFYKSYLSSMGTFEEFQSALNLQPSLPVTGPVAQAAPVSPQQIQRGEGVDYLLINPTTDVDIQPDLPRYKQQISDSYNQDLSKFGIVQAKLRDTKRKEELLDQQESYQINLANKKLQDYTDQRVKELQASAKTEDEYKIGIASLNQEIDNLRNKLVKETEFKTKDLRDTYRQAYEDKIHQSILGMSDEERKAFESTYRPDVPFDAQRWTVGASRVGQRLLSGFAAGIADMLPGGFAEVSKQQLPDYDTHLAAIESALRRGRGKGELKTQEQQNIEARNKRINQVGEEQYLKEKDKWNKELAAKKEQLSKYQELQSAERIGRTINAPQSWEEAKSKGASGIAEYAFSGAGQSLGLASPAIVTGILTGGTGLFGTIAPTLAGAATIAPVEMQQANEEGLAILMKKYPNLTREQIFEKNLDADLRDEAFKVGIQNAMLEQAGNLFLFGKFIPKNQVSRLLDIAVKRATSNAVVGGTLKVTTNTIGEAFTEWLQKKNQRIGSLQGANPNMSLEEATRLAMAEDDTEEFMAGLVSAAPITITSQLLSPSEKKANRIETAINTVANTGDPNINQLIDNEAVITVPKTDLGVKYGKEGKIGVSGGVQQGATTVQEGAQPEGGRAQAETGGVLQVSPETPGAQAEVETKRQQKIAELQSLLASDAASLRETGTGNLLPEARKQVQDELNSLLAQVKQVPPTTPEADIEAKKSDVVQTYEYKGKTQTVSKEVSTKDGISKVTFVGERSDKPGKSSKSGYVYGGLTSNSVQQFFDDYGVTVEDIAEDLSVNDIKTIEVREERTSEGNTAITFRLTYSEETGGMTSEPLEMAVKKQKFTSDAELAALTPTTQPAGQVTTEDLEAEGLRELEQLEQPTPPQPTAEQPTVTTQPIAEQPEVLTEVKQIAKPTTQQPANLNDFKRYFFNKDPKAFGGNLGTALGMSQIGWQKAYNKFAKNATPEEIRMLDALRGKEVEPVTPQPVEEEIKEEDVIIINKTQLLNAGYTNEQVQLVENNPEKFGQIDDKIVNLETNEVIKPTGKKKVQERPKKRPKETFPKKTYADLEKAMFTPGVKLDELLRIVIGMNNDYSALAEQLLNIYKSNKTVRLAKFDTNRLSGRSEKRAWGVYRSYNNTVAVFVNDIKEFWKNRAKVGKISPREVQPETESSVSRILLHEIVHAYTVKQIYNAIPAARSRNAQVRALQAYLKHGDNQGIKDIITLYLSAREQTKDLEKKVESNAIDTEDWNLVFISEEAGGTKAYGLKNIKEFLTEAFTQTEFQRLLNRLESPIAPKKSTWQSFVDAVKKILRIATTGAKELSPVKAGSILESVLRVAPDIMITDQEARTGDFTEEVDMSPAPLDATATALIKIGQGLVNKGLATEANLIDMIKQRVSDKFNIDVDSYADAIRENVNIVKEPTTGQFDVNKELKDIVNTPYNNILTSEKPEAVSVSDFRSQKVEALADFLRGKVAKKEEVFDFVLSWNEANPNNQISKSIAEEAYSRLQGGKREPAAKVTLKLTDLIKQQAQTRARGMAEGVRVTTKEYKNKIMKMVQDAIKGSNLSRNQINSIIAAVKRVNLFTPGSISKLADRIAKLEADAAYADKVNLAYSLKSKLKNPPSTIPPNIQDISKKLSKIEITDDTIDEYIEKASSILSSFIRPDMQGFSTVKVLDIEIFIDNYYRNLEKEMVANLLNATSREDRALIEELVDPNSQKLQQDILNQLAKEEKRKETIANLQDIASSLLKDLDNVVAENRDDKESLALLKKFDVKTENLKALVNFIRLADNIVTNNDFSGVGKIESEIKAATEVKPTIEAVKKYKKTAAGISTVRSIWLGITGSLQNIAIKATAAAREANILNNFLGLAKYEELSSQATQRVNKVEKALDDKITALDKKYKTNLMSNEEQIKFTILSELAKYVNDPTANINQIVNNIENDIRELLDSNKKYATKIAKVVYDVIDNMYKKGSIIGNRKEDPKYPGFMFKDGEVKGSAYMAQGYFEKNEPAVYELWKYFTTNVFTDELFKESEKVYGKYYNGILTKSKNYTPTSFRKIGEGLPEDAFATDSYSPQPNKRYKEANRGKRSGYTYSYVQSIRDAINAYREITTDNLTMPAQFQFNAAISRPELKEIMDGELRDFYIKDYKTRTNRTRSIVDGHLKETQIILDLLSRSTKNIMNVTKLFSIRQIAQQFLPALTSLNNLLGAKYVKYLAISVPKEFDEIIKMTSLGEGSLEEGILNLNNSFNFSDEAAYNALIKGLNKIQNKTSKLTVKALDPVIGKPDMNIRRRGWRAFYFKRLDELGVSFKDIDLKTEIDKQDDPKRIEARTYASFMIQKTMAPTTKFSKAEIWKQKGIMNAVVNNYLPFGSFMINYKNRIVDAMSMISNGNIKEGEAELRAAVSESLVFSTIQLLWAKIFTVPLANALYSGIFGTGLGEEEEDEILFFTPTEWKQFWTNIVTDVNPAAISDLSNLFIDFGNYMTWMTSDSDTTFDEWLEDKEAPSIFKKQTFEPVGYFGMAARDAQDMYYGVTNLYNTTKEDGVYRIPNYLYKDSKLEITEDVMKIAQWDLVFKTVGNLAPGELKSAWRMVKKEEIKYQKEKQKSKNK